MLIKLLILLSVCSTANLLNRVQYAHKNITTLQKQNNNNNELYTKSVYLFNTM